MDFVGVGLVLFGLAWAGGFGFAHFRAAGRAKEAEGWPCTSGKVLLSEVRKEERDDRDGHSTTWYNPLVAYSYRVGGRDLQARRLCFGNPRFTSEKKAAAAVAPYPVGGNIIVRYNPDKHEDAVLETRKPHPVYLIMALFGLLFIGFGWFWISFS